MGGGPKLGLLRGVGAMGGASSSGALGVGNSGMVPTDEVVYLEDPVAGVDRLKS